MNWKRDSRTPFKTQQFWARIFIGSGYVDIFTLGMESINNRVLLNIGKIHEDKTENIACHFD